MWTDTRVVAMDVAPRATVFIPVCDREHYAAAIESILAQRFTSYL